jgi:ubiquinone/menaquinone biosynthesis C-methylase UbiE
MAKDTTKDVQRFDKWSSTYEDAWLQQRLFDPVHQGVLALAARMCEPETILDIGCGTGKLLRKARTYWPQAQLLGVDPAEGMIEVARERTPGATFFVGSAEALPLPDAAVDMVVSTVSFHHWYDQAAGVREIARILRPGGFFFLADIAVPSWLAMIVRSARFHSAAQMRALFAQAGLEVRAQRRAHSRFVLVTVGVKPEKG